MHHGRLEISTLLEVTFNKESAQKRMHKEQCQRLHIYKRMASLADPDLEKIASGLLIRLTPDINIEDIRQSLLGLFIYIIHLIC